MAAPAKAVVVRVPPGPMRWLFPELDVAPAADGPSSGQSYGQSWGQSSGLSFEVAAATAPPRLLVPMGPLGRTVRRALVQQLRGRATEVLLDADLFDLERELGEAAACAPPGATIVLDACGRAQASAEEPRSVAQRRADAAADGPLPPWLLPFVPGPLLADQLGRALDLVTSAPDMFAAAELIPWFTTDPRAPQRDAETRQPESWSGLLPGDCYPAAVRERTRALHARLWLHRAAAFAALENCALGGYDLYLETLLGRRLQPRSAPGTRRPLLLGFCGIDGSGKSSHVESLRQWLAQRGLRVAVHKFYRHGLFHDTVTDVARLCTGDRNLHLWRIERLAKLMDSCKCAPAVERDLDGNDVVLFDRSIWTHYAAGAGRSHHDPFARELLDVLPVPHRTFLLDVPVDASLARLDARVQRTIDENPYMLSRYRDVLLELAGPHGFVVLDARHDFARNQAAIRAETERLLA
jgi:dTMP kinase